MARLEHNEDVLAARDHRKLGRELDLFALDPEVGKGLPLWLPNGTVIRDELEKLAKEMEFTGKRTFVNVRKRAPSSHSQTRRRAVLYQNFYDCFRL